MSPSHVPLGGSLLHWSVVVCVVRNTEITLVHIACDGWNTFQEAWWGKGKKVLKRVRRSESVLQNHCGSDPNDWEGMSVIAFWTPAMCNGVSGDAFVSWSHKARTRISCIAMCEFRDAMRCTQCTVGELSLNSATCAPSRDGHTCSIESHKRSRPAISKSKLVIVPVGFARETRASLMSCGHCTRKTVGGTPLVSPIMMPPTPCDDASFTPM